MNSSIESHHEQLEKALTGISGLDEITGGGLPRGRPTLVTGNAGSGKTLLSMQFLVQGAVHYNEPGVFMAFEETAEELTQNFASLGFDLDKLIASGKILIDYVHIDPSEIEETGDYDLEGLFIRLGCAIDAIGAKRVVLDTIEVLFSGFRNDAILRAELARLFRWLKDKGVTAIVTGERGEKSLTRYGLEEYVADCVITVDNRLENQIATRRLRIIKYRGSSHGTNEYPFLIEEDGISVLPITSLRLEHTASTDRISTGIERLDNMLDGSGYYRGSSILISGTAGTGKTSFANHFVDAACRRGERCIYFAFEESPSQIVRNMRSIGIDLEPWINEGLLQIRSLRPMAFGLEMHLVDMLRHIDKFQPKVVVFDPISNLINVGVIDDVKSMLTRLIDYMKTKEITTICTSLVDIEDEGQTGAGRLLIDGHLAKAAHVRDRQRAQPGDLCDQVPRHEALQPDSGVFADGHGRADFGRLSRETGRTLDGLGPRRTGGQRGRADAGVRSGEPAQEEDAGKKASLPEGKYGLAAFGARV